MKDELFNEMMQEIDNMTLEEYMALCDCTLFSKKPEVITVKSKSKEDFIKEWGCEHFDPWHCGCKAPNGTKCYRRCMLYIKGNKTCKNWDINKQTCKNNCDFDAKGCEKNCPEAIRILTRMQRELENKPLPQVATTEDIPNEQRGQPGSPLYNGTATYQPSALGQHCKEEIEKKYGCKWYTTEFGCSRPHWNINDCKKNCPTYTDKGKKYDTGKARWDLLPMRLIDETVDVITFGAKKYGPNNWQKVEDGKNRYYAALMRHIRAFREGEENDPESGLSHLAHAMCNIIFLSELYNGQ